MRTQKSAFWAGLLMAAAMVVGVRVAWAFTDPSVVAAVGSGVDGGADEENRARERLKELWSKIAREILLNDGIVHAMPDGVAAAEWRQEMQQELLDVAAMRIDWQMKSQSVLFLRRDLKSYADKLLQSWGGNENAKAEFVQAMQHSANEALREYAEATMRLAALRQVPLELQFTAVDGLKVDIERYRGKVVLIEYWATNCAGCVAQIPKLQDIYKQYHARGLEIVGLAYDKNSRKVLEFISHRDIPWPQRVDYAAHAQEFERYGFIAVSNLLLLDKEGRLLMHSTNPGKEELETIIRKNLE